MSGLRRWPGPALAALLLAAPVVLPTAGAAGALPVDPAVINVVAATDLVVDEAAGLVYVSRRTRHDVLAISLAEGKVVSTIPIEGNPSGLELSADGKQLFVALFGAGAVLAVDAGTGAVLDRFGVKGPLDNKWTWDLRRVGDGLFVSGDPGSSGLSHLVEIDLTTGTSAMVAGKRIIRAAPEFSWDGGDFLYAGEGFLPNSLYKLDLTQDGAPIVLEEPHGSISGAQTLAAGEAAVLIGSGQVLDPSDFSVLAALPFGVPAWSDDFAHFYYARPGAGDHAALTRYDAAPLASGAVTMTTGCPITPVQGDSRYKLEALAGDAGFVLLAPTTLCLIPAFPKASCQGLRPTLVGTPGADVLVGTGGDDVIAGLGGDDEIDAAGGDDVVCGGPGRDHLAGGLGHDRLYGGSGGDRLEGGEGADVLSGGNHNDTLLSGPGADTVDGGRGLDTVSYSDALAPVTVDLAAGTVVGSGGDTLDQVENVDGSPYRDTLRGSALANVLRGLAGGDRIDGREGNDRLFGGTGRDQLVGGPGTDFLSGGSGVDSCLGGETLSGCP